MTDVYLELCRSLPVRDPEWGVPDRRREGDPGVTCGVQFPLEPYPSTIPPNAANASLRWNVQSQRASLYQYET